MRCLTVSKSVQLAKDSSKDESSFFAEGKNGARVGFEPQGLRPFEPSTRCNPPQIRAKPCARASGSIPPPRGGILRYAARPPAA